MEMAFSFASGWSVRSGSASLVSHGNLRCGVASKVSRARGEIRMAVRGMGGCKKGPVGERN